MKACDLFSQNKVGGMQYKGSSRGKVLYILVRSKPLSGTFVSHLISRFCWLLAPGPCFGTDGRRMRLIGSGGGTLRHVAYRKRKTENLGLRGRMI